MSLIALDLLRRPAIDDTRQLSSLMRSFNSLCATYNAHETRAWARNEIYGLCRVKWLSNKCPE